MCYSVPASDHKYVSIQSVSQQGSENNNIATTTSCERNMWFTNFSIERGMFQNRDAGVERRQDMMLAKKFIEQGSAVRSCVCHLTCNRENGDNKQREKRLQEKLRTSKPKDMDSRETQDCKHKIG